MNENKYIRVRIRPIIKYKCYSQNNLKRLNELANKVLFVKKLTIFFYQIENENTLIFVGDMDKDEFADPLTERCYEIIEFKPTPMVYGLV